MVRRLAAAAIVVIGACVAYVLACGPFTTDLETVAESVPANLGRYSAGELGIVRPRFSTRYLLQAYRVFAGQPPAPQLVLHAEPDSVSSPPPPGEAEWRAIAARVLGTEPPRVMPFRALPDYAQFLNCADDAFASAVRTLQARVDRFTAAGQEATEFARGQIAVFQNCEGTASSAPPPAPAAASALVRADRSYHAAAASFYAMQYGEAARRFHAIAADETSPWRPYGRYLAARAMLRAATVPADHPDKGAELAAAEADLRAVVDDPAAAALHRSALGLIDFVGARLRPVQQLHTFARTLSASRDLTEQAFQNYRWTLAHLTGDVEETRRAVVAEGDDLSDWMLSMQGDGADAPERWRATRSMPWLVAALWHVRGPHELSDALLDAARSVDRRSGAYPTVAFLRVRLLARLGHADEARAVLAALPRSTEAPFDAEAVNLLRAERLMLATTIDEFLQNAGRAVFAPVQLADKTVFGADAAVSLNDRFALDRLVDAAALPTLPQRLRRRVAIAAFTRAIVLRRDDAGRRAAPLLLRLAPVLKEDLERYLAAATPDDRHRAGILLLLRTPGMHATVDGSGNPYQGPDDDRSYARAEPDRALDHVFRRNWWNAIAQRVERREIGRSDSEIVGQLYVDGRVPPPAFASADDRAAVERELQQLAAAGDGHRYLAVEALAWAAAAPADANVPEALARVVEGWRWALHDERDDPDLPRRAFALLHRQYGQSEAAKRTPYWYK